MLVAPEFADAAGPACRIVVERPPEAMLKVLPLLYAAPVGAAGGASHGGDRARRALRATPSSIGAYAVIGEGAELGDRVVIGAHCDVGRGVRIGDDSHLVSAVTLYPGTIVGRRVRLHAGVRIGSDGFGYVYAAGAHQKIPHVGRCVIEDDVEIGANTAIDRGSIDDTVIGAGTKIDNLVHIAHNVRLGRLCLIAAQVGISGSTTLRRRRRARRAGRRRRAPHDRRRREDRRAVGRVERRAGRARPGRARSRARTARRCSGRRRWGASRGS